MTIDKDDGDLWVNCDRCPESENLLVDDFQEAVEVLKSLGWRPVKDGAVWSHLCPSCKEEAND